MVGQLINLYRNKPSKIGTASGRTTILFELPPTNSRGFTLVELIVVCAILGCLVIIALPILESYRESARVASCAADIRTLESDINAYILEKSTYPTSLNQVGRGDLRDPWGNPYSYTKIAEGGGPGYQDFSGVSELNTDFDLYSLGKDGASSQSLASGNPTSEDDVIRAGDGSYVGLGSMY
jgi:prepilin-type N-terminal cleavage/methylation domain-containing protein